MNRELFATGFAIRRDAIGAAATDSAMGVEE